MTYSSRQKNESLNYEIEELINMKELISKGDKGTDCDTDLQAFWQNNILELKKGFMSLLLSKRQAQELNEWLNSPK